MAMRCAAHGAGVLDPCESYQRLASLLPDSRGIRGLALFSHKDQLPFSEIDSKHIWYWATLATAYHGVYHVVALLMFWREGVWRYRFYGGVYPQ